VLCPDKAGRYPAAPFLILLIYMEYFIPNFKVQIVRPAPFQTLFIYKTTKHTIFMKKLSILVSAFLLFGFTTKDNSSISKKERKYAINLLKETEKAVVKSVAGLSEAQLNFKPAPDKWSVEDCVKHIATTEQGLWQMTNGTIQAAANPEKRADVKATDEQVVQMIESREKKVKTAPAMEPQNTPYKSLAEALESFKTDRAKLIEYVKKTDADLRNHVVTMPFASFDSYQMILFIAAHSNRHTKQIEEVKADPNFPKN